MFIAPADLPLPDEYRMFALEGLIQEPPADIAERTVVFLDCGNIDRNSASVLRDGAHLLNIDHHHDNTRFGTLNHVVAGGLVHGGDRVGPDARRSGCAPTRGDRGGAVHRADHRHRALHVREHRPARAPDGGRADRGRRRRAGRLPPPVRGHAARASSRCSRSRSRSVQRFDAGRADARGAERGGLRARATPRRATPRGSSTSCARCRARRSRCSCASSPAARARASTKSRCAPPTTTSTSRSIARAQGGGGHRRAAGFSTTLDARRSWSRSCARRSPRSCTPPPTGTRPRRVA